MWGSEKPGRVQSQASSIASSLLPSSWPSLDGGADPILSVLGSPCFKEKGAAASSGKVGGRNHGGGQSRYKVHE